MNKRFLMIVVSAVIVLGLFLFLFSTRSHNPVAVIQILDVSGKPIAGAKARPYALRPKKGGADYFWTEELSVKPLPVTSDANGFISVPYPFYIFEKLETGEISVAVDHPNFCHEGFPRNIAFAPPANARLFERLAYPLLALARRAPAHPDPIVLKRGGILRLSAYLDSPDKLVTNIHAECTSTPFPENDFWRHDGQGWLTSRRINQGGNAARVVYLPEKGKCWFSDAVNFTSGPGQSNEFKLQLKPGLRLAGRLDRSVPRPVRHGRVQVQVQPQGAGTGLSWQSTRLVNEDGTFVFEQLPPGNLEIIALCDGFVSQDGTGGSSGLRHPQAILLDANTNGVEVRMEPTATCVITVLDDRGKPLSNATVGFWPNVIWGARASTIFAQATYESEDMIRSGEKPDWKKIRAADSHLYSGTTDARGIAVISNLPSFDKAEYFSVSHTDYEMPIDTQNGYDERETKINTRPGQTKAMTVKLQKVGTQIVQPNR